MIGRHQTRPAALIGPRGRAAALIGRADDSTLLIGRRRLRVRYDTLEGPDVEVSPVVDGESDTAAETLPRHQGPPDPAERGVI